MKKEVTAYAARMIELLAQAMRLQSSKPSDAEYYMEAKRIKKEMLEACHTESHHLTIKRCQDFFVEEEAHLQPLGCRLTCCFRKQLGGARTAPDGDRQESQLRVTR